MGDAGTPVAVGTRDAILTAAATVLVQKSGASLAEIAVAAGVGRTTIHRAFPTRADLITALALQSTERIRGVLEESRLDDGPVPEVLARLVVNVLPLADEMRFLDAGPEVWNLPELRDAWCSLTSAAICRQS
jgi:AcrR family transcriptional regulator